LSHLPKEINMVISVRMMKQCGSLTVLFWLLFAAWAGAEVIDSVAAVVNQDVITVSEVEEAGQPVFAQITAETPPGPQRQEALRQARQAVLDKLINKHLMLQQADEMKISVSPAEVEAAKQDILQRGGLSEQDFQHELKKMGLTAQQYQENLKEQILSSKLISYAVRAKVVIPEEKLREYYENSYPVKKAGYHLLQIGITVQGNDRKAAAEKAEELRRQAVAGADFRELARQHSELPSAADGGDIGTFQEDELAAATRAAVTSLQPGGISPVLDTGNSFMIFKLLSAGKEAAKPPFESVKEEIHDLLQKQEMEARYQTWIEEIRRQAYIKIL
jgi:peptidyl-prolyl cis-trans isomerase SurA